MAIEKKPLTDNSKDDFAPLPEHADPDNKYPTRGLDNQKIEVADLFTHFTASIIKEDVLFIR
jgi:hypothetical protein